jgi:pyrimidine operon attenuation protein/uracil phosphoribosyltransferase
MTGSAEETPLLNAKDVGNTIRRLAFQILERHPALDVAFVGIHRRGVTLARRVAEALRAEKAEITQGTLDISFHRDDLYQRSELPTVESSDLSFDPAGANIILFDDVIFTGRTIRSAIDCLMGFGRPARIELAVLVDRGNRELPIQPDYAGLTRPMGQQDYLQVRFTEIDGEDGLYLGSSKERSEH